MTSVSSMVAAIINLNQPDHYLSWSIFLVSLSNLIVIIVMVAIFSLALLLPFPHVPQSQTTSAAPGGTDQEAREPAEPVKRASAPEPGSAGMWTRAVREAWLRVLPPERLLPDSQPAYVASWVYVFGVAALAGLFMAILSGALIAIGGASWWETNPIGHFFNSMHMWSVELFMAFIALHLWAKFWMAAWRGKRSLTWISGLLAFLAAIVECFTGYLSQQNFDSQWIATNGKDAINATGLGGFFNLMDFGQMLLWHVVLLPLVLVGIVAIHVLLVRVRGVSHPLPVRGPRSTMSSRKARLSDAAEWTGPRRHYDIVKEASIATAVVFILTLALAGIFSSPDLPSVTIRTWAQVAPADFLGTAASELAGTSETARYGPPYNHGSSNVQQLGISLQRIAGVHEPINPAQAFVLSPLSTVAVTDPGLAAALKKYESAPPAQQKAWDAAYEGALDKVQFRAGAVIIPPANDGPVPTLLSTELSLARSGALDADLIARHAFYGTNFTYPLMFMEDGSYFAQEAKAQHMYGTQWGVMNETGSYPGQPWLWLYTLWYQVPGVGTSPNADLYAVALTGLGTLLLLATPFLPGISDLPRLVPIYRLVWKQWYGRQNNSGN